MIDFQNIRSGVAGQREAFEELVCQLARRSPPEHASQYRRIHGAGGDGGIEAYWLLKDGTKHGFQAKFHVRSGDVNWTAIDKSVEAALNAHPTITKYYVAVACDLTDNVPNRRGKSGWAHWKAHQKAWEKSAKDRQMTVEFVPWTASTLDDLLTTPIMCGLREYWFGAIELSPEWLARQCERTVEALEERYHPEDHIEVRARACFDGLLRNETWRNTLRAAIKNVVDHDSISTVSNNLSQGSRNLIQAIADNTQHLLDLKPTIDLPASEVFPRQRWIDTCTALNDLAYKTQNSLYDDQHKVQKAAAKTKKQPVQNHFSRPGEDVYPSIRDVLDFRGAIDSLIEIVETFQIDTDVTRFCLIEGRAGSGKSHLLASEVQNALSLGAPCLFLLGSHFSGSTQPQQDLLRHFDFAQQKYETLLGALSAAAESNRLRGLIVIDAINEGPGINLWRANLATFVSAVLTYPNLAVCISCRSEYSKSLISKAVFDKATRVVINGFETEEERENAARIYMDRRAIVRPATPWLNPEFTNPLFLRTACLALERSNHREFPKGLRGTKELLRFFLEATADALGITHDGTGVLKRPVALAMLAIAKEMAIQRQDFLTIQQAGSLISQQFIGLAEPSNGTSWLDTLKHNGLLRFDPEPNVDYDDPLQFPQDVVRFSFQRFQDHLMAEAILEGMLTSSDVFDVTNGVTFTLNKYGVSWTWGGLIEALSIQVPEKFHQELVDLMPGGFDRWWDDHTVQNCFVESARWRSVEAFSERSLELLNRLNRQEGAITSLMIELSVAQAHPWNAELLHSNLMRRKLAVRDRFWTLSINDAHDDQSHPANRLIEWALGTGPTKAEDATISLALITLSWLLTSTAARVRDRATKSITALLIERSHLFPSLMERFEQIDDPYVSERILAAAYGACCIEPKPERLRMFSSAVFKTVFARAEVPPYLLMRDYARGIIEIAKTLDCLQSEVELHRCLPPYNSTKPCFSMSKEKVLARSKRLGASLITSSCFSGLGDFGRYTVEGRVHEFTDAALSGPQPVTAEELYDNCRADLVRDRPWVELAIMYIEEAYKRKEGRFDRENVSFIRAEPDHERIKETEKTLRILVSRAEFSRYSRECRPKLREDNQSRTLYLPRNKIAKEFDAERAKYWIANRAMAMGWTSKLFPYDRSGGEDRVRGAKIERIGKKYQRIALQELLARLADNYWLAPDWDGPSRLYNNPLDISFIRDIDPTILPDRHFAIASASRNPTVPELSVPDLLPTEMQAWLDEPDLPERKLYLALCSDLENSEWVSLYRYAHCDIDAENRKSLLETPWKQTEFHFLSMHILRPADRKRLIAFAPPAHMDFHEWLPHDFTDGPYRGELGIRDTWKSDFWETRESRTTSREEFEIASPVSGYSWESHLDGSLPDGISVQLPQPWLLEQLSLKADPRMPGAYVDQFGELVIFCNRGRHNSYCLARKERLLTLLQDKGLSPLWSVIGERGAWWDGNIVRGKRLRFNGMLWFEGKRVRTSHWSKFD